MRKYYAIINKTKEKYNKICSFKVEKEKRLPIFKSKRYANFLCRDWNFEKDAYKVIEIEL